MNRLVIAAGFLCAFAQAGSGGHFSVGQHGALDYAGHGGDHPSNDHKEWLIDCHAKVHFSWERFDLESDYDILFISHKHGVYRPTMRTQPRSLLGPVRLVFTSDSSTQQTEGFRALWSCGTEPQFDDSSSLAELLEVGAGVLDYPGTARYKEWLIDCHAKVYFTWERFDLESNAATLHIHDEHVSHRVLPHAPNNNISGPVRLVFTSDLITPVSVGFRVQWSCGMEAGSQPEGESSIVHLEGVEGALDFPGHDGAHPNRKEWLIDCHAKVYFSWERYNLESSHDSLRMYHEYGSHEATAWQADILQGPVRLVFTSDRPAMKQGFYVRWSCGDDTDQLPVDGAGDRVSLLEGDEGVLDYPGGEVKEWLIECHAKVYFLWERFDLEENRDTVSIHHGHGEYLVPQRGQEDSLQGPVRLIFTSDRNTLGTGFRLRWSCGIGIGIDGKANAYLPSALATEIHGAEGTLDYGGGHNHKEWLIDCHAKVHFSWERFDLESDYDILFISHKHGVYRPTMRTQPRSLLGPVRLVFTSDSSTQKTGFRVQWSCDVPGARDSNTTVAPTDPRNVAVLETRVGDITLHDPNEDYKEWHIQCGQEVRFTWGPVFHPKIGFGFLQVYSRAGNVEVTPWDAPQSFPGPVQLVFTRGPSPSFTNFTVQWECGSNPHDNPEGSEIQLEGDEGALDYPGHGDKEWLIDCHAKVHFSWERYDLENNHDSLRMYHEYGVCTDQPSSLLGPVRLVFTSDRAKGGFHVRWSCGIAIPKLAATVEPVWCTVDKDCRVFGDDAAVCRSSKCICGPGFEKPVQGAQAVSTCVRADTTSRARYLEGATTTRVQVVFKKGTCQSFLADAPQRPVLKRLLGAALGTSVGGLRVICQTGSVHLIMQSTVPNVKLAQLATRLDSFAHDVAASRELRSALGAISVARIAMGTGLLECASHGASGSKKLANICHAVACTAGYGVTQVGPVHKCVDVAGVSRGIVLGAVSVVALASVTLLRRFFKQQGQVSPFEDL